jgi:hypothetical protein
MLLRRVDKNIPFWDQNRLTTLSVINEAENGEPQLQKKRGKNKN